MTNKQMVRWLEKKAGIHRRLAKLCAQWPQRLAAFRGPAVEYHRLEANTYTAIAAKLRE